MTWTLGIETSTRRGSVALSRNGEICASRSLGTVPQQHARNLFVEIDAACRELGLQPGDLDRIAVSIGPGSFTGLRVGVVAAKTLAWSLNCELKAVDSFLVVAANSPPEVSAVTILGDAQRGDVFVGKYIRSATGVWVGESAIVLVPFAELQTSLSAETVVSGTGATRYEAEITDRCRLLPTECRDPQAEWICRLAERADIPVSDAWSLEPFYLRRSAAEEKWSAREELESAP